MNDATPREALEQAIWNAGPKTTTDAVIAHLWERADDPAVVEAVDSICIVHGMSRTESEGLIETMLTALIGPRPQGEETEHG